MSVASVNGRAARRKAKSKHRSSNRFDVVFIRKSGSQQENQGQIDNVRHMLKNKEVSVGDENWFICTVTRSKVQGNKDFQELRALVEADRVRNVYIESQDRFGTKNVGELFTLIGLLQVHGTHLIDLKNDMDLTATDDVTEMTVFIGGVKSKKERKDTAYRSMRTKVPHFLATGSWPSGVQPFGFGKSLLTPAGKVVWTWQPTTRTKGQLFRPDKTGKLRLSADGVAIPRKTKEEKLFIIKLLPSINKEFVKTVRVIFSLYTRAGLSRRQISARLNADGRLFYDKPFTHALVGDILTREAYVGDTHYGKTKSAEYHSFSPKGDIEPIETTNGKEKRKVKDRLVKENTHKGLIDRKTWQLAQEKLADEEERTSFSPRNPAYYLKPILVCGHCGKNMTGRPEKDPTTKERRVVYMCQTYVAGRSNGQNVKCGAYRITHDDAEKLLFDKIKELNLEYDELKSAVARASMDGQLSGLKKDLTLSVGQWIDLVDDGVEAIVEDYRQNYDVKPKAFEAFRQQALDYYAAPASEREQYTKRLRNMASKVEKQCVEQAKKKLAQLNKDFEKYTERWAGADVSDRQQAVLKRKSDEVEAEIALWEPRTKTISQRLSELDISRGEMSAKQKELLDEWPNLESREKGEALRRLFKTVTLYWDRKFIPRSKKPTRPLKTKRPGRFDYTLLKDKIGWEFSSVNLTGSW